jgi:hypothetical protein
MQKRQFHYLDITSSQTIEKGLRKVTGLYYSISTLFSLIVISIP